MSVLVHVTFDLDGASSDEYTAVREHLAKINLHGWAMSDTYSFIDLPSNTFLAEYNAPLTADIRDRVTDYIREVFKVCGVQGKIFVTAGEGWAWKQTIV